MNEIEREIQNEIKTIKRLIGISPSESIVRSVNSAVEALEKQIPKKPIYLTKSHRFPRCPICQCEVEDSCREMGFCDNCGQKLDWSVEE